MPHSAHTETTPAFDDFTTPEPVPTEVIDVDALSDTSEPPSLVTLDDGPDDVPQTQAEPDVSPVLTVVTYEVALRVLAKLHKLLGGLRFDALVGDATPFEEIMAVLCDFFRLRHIAASGGMSVRVPLELQVLLDHFRHTIHAALGLHPVQLLNDAATLCAALRDHEGLYFLHQMNIRRYPDRPADALHAELYAEHAAIVAAAPAALNRIAPIVDAGFNKPTAREVRTRARIYVTQYVDDHNNHISSRRRATYDARSGSARRAHMASRRN
ncbi:hypothetical protein DFP72DRAFT_1082469 [Ephemerocybe angulata]|uniref:Uncharacterized protein n=1 Tax=Ephemerocybe angulata TaxID=980116 RepID=A0A8H6H9L1_9AGAR|nr:hypothetical protein DFP72DRAFT_1082469 [Tulosesus angulatus]